MTTARREALIAVRGPFSFELALEILNGFTPAGLGEQKHAYRAAHIVHGRPLLITATQPSSHQVCVTVAGAKPDRNDLDAAVQLVERVFSLSTDATPFYELVGSSDPVIARLQHTFFGLRPVLFGSPFEALCWAVISQRISVTQAVRIKAGLTAQLGPALSIDRQRWQAFPSPEIISQVDPDSDAHLLRLPAIKLERLRALGERGMAGDFEANLLLSMPIDEALKWLKQSPGIGPWASEFALVRGAGHPDLLPHGERRFTEAVQSAYEMDHPPSDAQVAVLAERWFGYRSWAVFLLRVASQSSP